MADRVHVDVLIGLLFCLHNGRLQALQISYTGRLSSQRTEMASIKVTIGCVRCLPQCLKRSEISGERLSVSLSSSTRERRQSATITAKLRVLIASAEVNESSSMRKGRTFDLHVECGFRRRTYQRRNRIDEQLASAQRTPLGRHIWMVALNLAIQRLHDALNTSRQLRISNRDTAVTPIDAYLFFDVGKSQDNILRALKEFVAVSRHQIAVAMLIFIIAITASLTRQNESVERQ